MKPLPSPHGFLAFFFIIAFALLIGFGLVLKMYLLRITPTISYSESTFNPPPAPSNSDSESPSSRRLLLPPGTSDATAAFCLQYPTSDESGLASSRATLKLVVADDEDGTLTLASHSVGPNIAPGRVGRAVTLGERTLQLDAGPLRYGRRAVPAEQAYDFRTSQNSLFNLFNFESKRRTLTHGTEVKYIKVHGYVL